ADLRRQDDADTRSVEAVSADAGAGDARHARQLSRAEREDVHGHATADAGPDARAFHRVPLPQFRRDATAGRRREKALMPRSAATSALQRVIFAHRTIAR